MKQRKTQDDGAKFSYDGATSTGNGASSVHDGATWRRNSATCSPDGASPTEWCNQAI